MSKENKIRMALEEGSGTSKIETDNKIARHRGEQYIRQQTVV
jgi:hypothetical protein